MFPRAHRVVAFNNTKLENWNAAPKLSCKLNTWWRSRPALFRRNFLAGAVRRNAANLQPAQRCAPTQLQATVEIGSAA
jgi:hypothetical protein